MEVFGNELDKVHPALSIDTANNKIYEYAHFCEDDAEQEVGIFNDQGEVILLHETEGSSPDLAHWSDVVFLSWQRYSSTPTQLKYVIPANIQETDSKAWAVQAVINSGETLIPNYPKTIEFSIDTDYEKAILALHNGAGIGFLLARHKAQLGVKTVSSVTL
ncbi:uncharacterized protein PAC_15600 [Phialocephala subalpina]|uniref:Uncharacterized protein n=1 Tax=Phialocephala subalpina TaxID=576137 RepID=A0A1L7XKW1_9HELO|nr:uncharacterized protein PAC_15600 [Phialocephala subalpina]